MIFSGFWRPEGLEVDLRLKVSLELVASVGLVVILALVECT
jgi:hypothetical protein